MNLATEIFLADLAHTYSVENSSLTVPLGLGYIKAYSVSAHGPSVDISLFKHPEKFLARVTEEKPEIIGLANYGWNENLNRSVGGYVRKILPEAMIVAGGPNIDSEPRRRIDFLERHDYLDFLIIDGGEEAFAGLVDWWREHRDDHDKLPENIVWADDGKIRFTEEMQLKKIIDNIPSPYLSGFLDEFLEDGLVPMFETNRGCPFKCTFCAWGSASKNLVRQFDLNTSLAEISHVGERSRSRNWIFCDANFGILKRDVDIARAIRSVNEETGYPKSCQIWMAKNVTGRNLQIGEILGDIITPVMAVQSLDDEVLANVKRDNISTDIYAEYQKKFNKMGSRTYSDLIVPLPAATLGSHVGSLKKMFEYGVDIIQSHNMRLLSGAETNSTQTRDTYGFKTRYRLIHGDAGAYRCADGTILRSFEYEESLRATTTFTEEELFFLRKLHFLCDFSWNVECYKPLLKICLIYGVNPVDVLVRLLDAAGKGGATTRVAEFFARFDEESRNEWFDNSKDIEAYFEDDRNFNGLINQEFEKLNIQFSVILLKDLKADFDSLIEDTITSFRQVPVEILEDIASFNFSLFPQLGEMPRDRIVSLPENFMELTAETAENFSPSAKRRDVRFVDNPKREEVRKLLGNLQGKTLSKVLNTQDIALRDLQMDFDDDFWSSTAFRRVS